MKGRASLVLAGAVLLSGCGGEAGGGAAEAGEAGDGRPAAAAASPRFPAPGAEIPEYAAATLDGDTVALADYRGQVLLLNVWATWCPACEREMPSLQALHEDLGSQGLRVVGVSVDAGPGSAETVRDFLAEYGVTYTVLHDPDGRIQHTHQVFGIPTTYLVDRAGRVVKRWVGEVDFGAPEIRQEFARALAPGAEGSESGAGTR